MTKLFTNHAFLTVLIFFSFIFFTSCSNKLPKKQKFEENLANTLIQNYSMHDSPNELDKPGVIFRVTPDGKRFEVATLDLKTRRGKAEVSRYNGSRDLQAKFFLNFIGLKNLPLELNNSLSKNMEVKFEIDNVEIEKSDDLNVDDELVKIKKRLIENIKESGRENNKFYIIRESILAKKMKYSFDQNILIENRLEIELEKMAKAKPNINWKKEESFPLTFELDSYLRIFYKVEQLILTGSAAGDISVSTKNVSTPIYYEK